MCGWQILCLQGSSDGPEQYVLSDCFIYYFILLWLKRIFHASYFHFSYVLASKFLNHLSGMLQSWMPYSLHSVLWYAFKYFSSWLYWTTFGEWEQISKDLMQVCQFSLRSKMELVDYLLRLLFCCLSLLNCLCSFSFFLSAFAIFFSCLWLCLVNGFKVKYQCSTCHKFFSLFQVPIDSCYLGPNNSAFLQQVCIYGLYFYRILCCRKAWE